MEKKNESKEPKKDEPNKQDGELSIEEADKVSGGIVRKTFNPQPDPPLG